MEVFGGSNDELGMRLVSLQLSLSTAEVEKTIFYGEQHSFDSPIPATIASFEVDEGEFYMLDEETASGL